VIAVVFVGAALARPHPWGPWDERWAPVGGVDAVPAASPPRSGPLEAAYRFYRDRISPSDGPTCPYYPTCSAYAILSVRERGPFVGGLLTIDRLLREYPGMERFDHYPMVMPHETPRLYDPVAPRDRSRGRGEGGRAARR
jgi:putative component of membrane protein insertase Oxa1/YidC/SpoIIIJ protein YidD